MLNEEYGEALLLAQQYGLNCDLVYLRQWRSYPVSVATIQDYLVSSKTCTLKLVHNINATQYKLDAWTEFSSILAMPPYKCWVASNCELGFSYVKYTVMHLLYVRTFIVSRISL